MTTSLPDIEKLTKLLVLSREMEALLISDKDYFVTNDLESIQKNNTKKSKVLTDIVTLLDHSNKTPLDANYLKTLKENAALLPDDESQICINLIDELEATIINCQQLIAINGKVAYVNMERVHALFDKVARLREEESCLYEKHGSLTK